MPIIIMRLVMFDNIYTFYDDAEYIITEFNVNKVIKLLKNVLKTERKLLLIMLFLQVLIFIKMTM